MYERLQQLTYETQILKCLFSYPTLAIFAWSALDPTTSLLHSVWSSLQPIDSLFCNLKSLESQNIVLLMTWRCADLYLKSDLSLSLDENGFITSFSCLCVNCPKGVCGECIPECYLIIKDACWFHEVSASQSFCVCHI